MHSQHMHRHYFSNQDRVLRSVKSSLNGFANLTERTSSFVRSVSRCSRDLQLFIELGVKENGATRIHNSEGDCIELYNV
jgi:hypothetical protein